MSNSFKICPTYFSRGAEIFVGGCPLLTGLIKMKFYILIIFKKRLSLFEFFFVLLVNYLLRRFILKQAN